MIELYSLTFGPCTDRHFTWTSNVYMRLNGDTKAVERCLPGLENGVIHSGKKNLSYHEEAIVRILSKEGIKSIIRFVIEVCSDAERLIKFLETNDFILFQIYEHIKAFMAGWLGKVYEVDKMDNVFKTKHLGLESGLKNVEKIILPSSLTKYETNEQVNLS